MAPRSLHDHYDIMRQLGHGAMAEVVLARRKADDVQVAVKRALPHLAKDANIARRFKEEVRVMPHISHPNIVRTLEICDDNGAPAIVLEHIEGPSLIAVDRAARGLNRPLSHAAIAHIGGELLSALGYLHDVDLPGGERGVTHRDVTPSNILLRPSGSVVLIDFGVAFAAGRDSLTKTGALVGKIGYMAPEVLGGDRSGVAADLFSTTVILYELLCGHPPFEGAKAADVIDAVVAGRITPPAHHAPDLTADLVGLLERGLKVAPADRFEDAWEMAMDLNGALPLPDATDIVSIVGQFSPELTLSNASAGAVSQPTTEDGSMEQARPGGGDPPTTTRPATATSAPNKRKQKTALTRTTPTKTDPKKKREPIVREVTVTQIAPGTIPDRANSRASELEPEFTRTVVTPHHPDVTVTQVAPIEDPSPREPARRDPEAATRSPHPQKKRR